MAEPEAIMNGQSLTNKQSYIIWTTPNQIWPKSARSLHKFGRTEPDIG